MGVEEEDPREDQVMDFEVDDEHSIYEIGGPSSAILEASHLGGHPLFIVTSRDARHHQELAALHVRLDGVESIHTELKRSEWAIERDIRWLGERDEVIQHRTLSLLRRVDGLSSDRVVDSIAILELQPRMTTVEEMVQTLVDTLRHKVDGLHRIAATMSKQVQILETALQEVRAENQDLQTRLSASESSERCMITCLLKIEERLVH
ncbi:hypothetical protein Tco_0419268 [Tanacetum coccineum]